MKKRLLFMIKSVIAGAVAMAVVSFGVNAALTTPQGQGRVTFNGTVVDDNPFSQTCQQPAFMFFYLREFIRLLSLSYRNQVGINCSGKSMFTG
ncbi:hypothetical protein ECOLIN_16020 [Escherichia coli Nissle 1917]|nr:hypothetical protein ECOLIN_16020 [Escherichia coli Nissle 1917]